MEEKRLSIRAFAKEIGKSHTWVAEKCKDGTITLDGDKIPKNNALSELKELGFIGDGKKEENGSQFPPVIQSKAKFEFFRARDKEIDVLAKEGKIIYKDDLKERLDKLSSLILKGVGVSFFKAYDQNHPNSEHRENVLNYFTEHIEVNEFLQEAHIIIKELSE